MAVAYKRGGATISVEQIDGFGKNPGLWIGTDDPNRMVKVASFGSEEKARLFCNWMDYLIGVANNADLDWEGEDD